MMKVFLLGSVLVVGKLYLAKGSDGPVYKHDPCSILCWYQLRSGLR